MYQRRHGFHVWIGRFRRDGISVQGLVWNGLSSRANYIDIKPLSTGFCPLLCSLANQRLRSSLERCGPAKKINYRKADFALLSVRVPAGRGRREGEGKEEKE